MNLTIKDQSSGRLQIATNLLSGLVLVSACSCANAQTAPQIVNPAQLSTEPLPSPQGGDNVRIGRGGPSPSQMAGRMGEVVLVRRISIENGFPELAVRSAAIAQAMAGRRLTVAEINDYAAELQSAYLASGFGLVLVDVPGQAFRNGVVRFVVSDRFIEDLDLTSVSERARPLVRARLQRLIGRRRLPQAEFQRQVLLLGDIAGLLGSTTLRPGRQRDGVVLVVQAKESLVSVATGIDNRLPGFLGRTQLQGAFAYNNVLGLGEQIHAEGASGTHLNHVFDGQARFQAFGGGVSLPIGADGLTLAAAYSSVRTNPILSPGTFTFGGESETTLFDRTTVRLNYPLLLTEKNQIRVQGGFEHIDDHVHVGPLPILIAGNSQIFNLSQDRYDDFRVAGELATQALPNNARFAGALFFTHGIDGREASATVPLSQPGATPLFSKLRLAARYDQPLLNGFALTVFARAQTSFGNSLPVPEQLSLDGVEALSGFSDGVLNVDSGAVGRAELSRTILSGGSPVISFSPYAFVAAGGGEHYQPFFGQAKNLQAESVGGGVRAATNFFGPDYQEIAAIEAAKNFANVPLFSIPYYDGDYRVSFSYSMRFSGTPSTARPVVELADMPTQAAQSTSSPWGGFYAGLNAGYGLSAGDNVVNSATPAVANLDPVIGGNYAGASAASASTTTRIFSNGFLGGGQVGYNMPAAQRYVLGAEADLQGSGIVGRGTSIGHGFISDGLNTATITSTTQNEKFVDWLGTLRARIGYLARPNLLLYGTGGLAFGEVKSSNNTFQQASGLLAAPTLQFVDSSSSQRHLASGYTAGAGLEYMFASNLSFKAEYLFYDLGVRTQNTGPLIETNFTGLVDVINSSSQTRFDGHIIRAGLNYHFNGQAEPPTRELADLDPASTSIAPPPARWTGVYGGLNAGYAFDAHPTVANNAAVTGTALDQILGVNAIAPASAQSATVRTTTAANGFVGGGTLGYNRGFGRFVAGVEADIDGAGANGKGNAFGNAVATIGATQNPVASIVANEKSLEWLSTLRGRLGFLVTPGLLAFGTGGLAVGGVSQQTTAFQLFGGPVGSFLVSSGSFGRQSGTLVGWSVGGGLEWMMTPRLSLKAEYIRFDLGSLISSGGTLATSFGFSSTAALSSRFAYGGDFARAGLNYHFQ